jgi:hypothetical protein
MLSTAAEAGMHVRRYRRPHGSDVERELGAQASANERHDPLPELQRTAGNRAVAELLGAQRVDAPATVQRQPADGAESANAGEVTAAGSMTIPELDKTLPILAFSRRADRTQKGEATSGEAELVIEIEHLDPRIQQAMLNGRKLATVVVTVGPIKVTMKNVLISGVHVTREHATVSLVFEVSELDHEPQPERGREERDQGHGFDLAP